MATRALLHISKQKELEDWLETQGYVSWRIFEVKMNLLDKAGIKKEKSDFWTMNNLTHGGE